MSFTYKELRLVKSLLDELDIYEEFALCLMVRI